MFRRVFLLASVSLLVLACECRTSAAQDGAQSNAASKDRASLIKPSDVDYSALAFYPKRWKASGSDFQMLAWKGDNVVFLVKQGEYDPDEMTRFVGRLDRGWQTYSEIIGKSPIVSRQLFGLTTICAIPKPNLSCGYGCGYVGATGIEVSAFYSVDLPAFRREPSSFQHYYFYELGRNFFVFGDRHSIFTTGFAVFMRYVCMDRLEATDLDSRTRKIIESCEQIYADSDLGFFATFTNFGSGEKSNRLTSQGGIVRPSDQPVMYATAMLKLRKDYGGDEWVSRFYQRLQECKPGKARDLTTAKRQCYNWLVCASAAAGKDLTHVFSDRWRMPLKKDQRALLKAVQWKSDELHVASLVEQLEAIDP